jgi:hypothetical protein
MQTNETRVGLESNEEVTPQPTLPTEADETVLFFSQDAPPPGRIYKYAWIAQYMEKLEVGGNAIQITFTDSNAASRAMQGAKLACKAIYAHKFVTWDVQYKTRKQHPGNPDLTQTDLFIWRTA